MIFDILMLAYLAISVFAGYKRGFLASISGILALVLSFVIYKIFDFSMIYFVGVYFALSIAIIFLAKVIRKLKLPIIAKTDAILGLACGAVNGLLGVALITVLMFNLTRFGGASFAESSMLVGLVEKIVLSLA